jgi:hypothetical protein
MEPSVSHAKHPLCILTVDVSQIKQKMTLFLLIQHQNNHPILVMIRKIVDQQIIQFLNKVNQKIKAVKLQ